MSPPTCLKPNPLGLPKSRAIPQLLIALPIPVLSFPSWCHGSFTWPKTSLPPPELSSTRKSRNQQLLLVTQPHPPNILLHAVSSPQLELHSFSASLFFAQTLSLTLHSHASWTAALLRLFAQAPPAGPTPATTSLPEPSCPLSAQRSPKPSPSQHPISTQPPHPLHSSCSSHYSSPSLLYYPQARRLTLASS